MGCNSNYMQQTSDEDFFQNTAKHIVYVLKQLNKTVPAWVSKTANDYYAQDPEDKLTPLLCSTLSSLTKKQLNDIVYNGRVKEARALAEWWDEHQANDKSRIAQETKLKKQKALKQSALKKLTKDEIEALRSLGL